MFLPVFYFYISFSFLNSVSISVSTSEAFPDCRLELATWLVFYISLAWGPTHVLCKRKKKWKFSKKSIGSRFIRKLYFWFLVCCCTLNSNVFTSREKLSRTLLPQISKQRCYKIGWTLWKMFVISQISQFLTF